MAVAILMLSGGCAGVGHAPPQAPPAAAPTPSTASAAPAPPTSAPAAVPTPSTGSAAHAPPTSAPAAAPTPRGKASAGTSAPRADLVPAKPPAQASVGARAPTPLPAKEESATPSLAKTESAPQLDLTTLENRLKETKAIGLMTKLAIKNQVDDLLNRFRDFYHGRLHTTLAELRQPFDLLILKVLSLLQDSDPPLASAIAASREALWKILSDPTKFANL